MAIHQYRAKLALLSNQKNTCKRELKAAADVFGFENSKIEVSIIRAQLSFTLSDYSGALEQIGSIVSLPDHAHDDYVSATIYFNNLGCINYKMKKFNAAVHYFSRSLSADEKVNSGPSWRHNEVLYNL